MSTKVETKICAAALRLAAKHGWSKLTLEQIAKAAKIPPAQIKKLFAETNRILPAMVRFMDARAEAKTSKADNRAKPHDRLFEVMMARFDALQEHRMGILSILNETRRDPSLARLIIPEQIRSMHNMLELARVAPRGVQGQVAGFGLLAVYYRALWCWHRDQTKDMAPTMAALDQGLRCAARLAEILFRDS